MGEKVFIRDVSLRDGLQMVRSQVPTSTKMEWLDGLVAAGFRRIEVTSFVPPSILPQFADAAQIAGRALSLPGVEMSALVVNLKGAQRAFNAGFKFVTYVVSASEAHSMANARRSVAAALDEFRLIAEERSARYAGRPIMLEGAIATSYGCSLQGKVAQSQVLEIAAQLVEAGADSLMVADTVGYADPAAVRALFTALPQATGAKVVAAHFHDTRGLGLANILAALDVGVRRFDASTAGLGGCPFAPGATGNVNSEDCAFLLQSMGFDTGIDIEKLVDLHGRIGKWLPDDRLHGAIARAGLPKIWPSVTAQT